ncbi:MAG: hypothetical protein ACRD2C_05000 [Acidimicrobiales bacterium]
MCANGRGLDATQLLDPGSWCAVGFWLGVVLVGMATLMTLLDWGELSGGAARRRSRRRLARVLAVGGIVLLVAAGAAAVLLG